MHRLETIGDNLEKESNNLTNENQTLEKETENYEDVESLNLRQKHDLEAAEKTITRLSFPNSNLTNKDCCLKEELNKIKNLTIDNNE